MRNERGKNLEAGGEKADTLQAEVNDDPTAREEPGGLDRRELLRLVGLTAGGFAIVGIGEQAIGSLCTGDNCVLEALGGGAWKETDTCHPTWQPPDPDSCLTVPDPQPREIMDVCAPSAYQYKDEDECTESEGTETGDECDSLSLSYNDHDQCWLSTGQVGDECTTVIPNKEGDYCTTAVCTTEADSGDLCGAKDNAPEGDTDLCVSPWGEGKDGDDYCTSGEEYKTQEQFDVCQEAQPGTAELGDECFPTKFDMEHGNDVCNHNLPIGIDGDVPDQP